VDRARLAAYAKAAEAYLTACAGWLVNERQLPEAHERVVALAERWLPVAVEHERGTGVDA